MATKATGKKSGPVRQPYLVLSPYQCPNRKRWYQKGDEVQLLPCEAQFLLLSGKVKAKVATKVKGESNA